MSSMHWQRRWDPFREFQREVGRFFETFEPLQNWRVPRPFPAVNLYDSGEQYLLTAELAGDGPRGSRPLDHRRDPDLRGERKRPEGVGEESYRRQERQFGRWARTVTLPERVDGGRVSAGFAHGILTVSLPKAEEARPRHIAVTSTGPAQGPGRRSQPMEARSPTDPRRRRPSGSPTATARNGHDPEHAQAQAPAQVVAGHAPLIDIHEGPDGPRPGGRPPRRDRGGPDDPARGQRPDPPGPRRRAASPRGPGPPRGIPRRPFQRSFILSDEVERGRITAELKDGVLRLHLPKAERAKTRRIEIKTS